MKNVLFLICCLSLTFRPAYSQAFDSLDANHINAGFSPGTSFFWGDTAGARYSLFESPHGGGVRSVYSSNLWLSGLDGGGNVHVCGTPYGRQMYWGPVAASYGGNYDARYFRVWKVTRDEINDHRAHYSSAGYTIPAHIAQWPGNGDTTNGEAAVLAPFADRNGNGLYEPSLGDYPDVCGDQAIFMMLNDAAPASAGLGCLRIGAEFHILAYALDAVPEDTALSNTIFFKIKIINRSGGTYRDVRMSSFVDIDLGCIINDRMGCDTMLNSFFGYNDPSGPDGPSCAPVTGYGYRKAAQGITFLNQRMSAFEYSSNNGPTGVPSTCAQIRNSALSLWTNGVPVTSNGSGYSDATGYTSYVYPGDPTDPTQWSEIHTQSSFSNPPGDRRGIGSISLGDMTPGQMFAVDMAYITSFADSSEPLLSEVTQLKRDIRTIRSLYDQGSACSSRSFPAGIDEADADAATLLPNPTHGTLTLKSVDRLIGTSYTLTEMTGSILQQERIEKTKTIISLAHLASGIYLIHVGGRPYKVVKE